MNIAILGYGVEGESVYKYYRTKYPDAVITVYDNNSQPKNPLPSDVKFVGGVKDFKGIVADLAVKTPAISPDQVQVTGEVTTMAREFLKVCPAQTIGVTGTKGKGTTCSLIKSILDTAGKRAWLVGNIGIGAFDVLHQIKPSDIVVYELSSFQLWDIDVSPHVAVVLGVEPEHLDVHKDLDDYVGAKANIAKHQKPEDLTIYLQGNQYSELIAKQSPGKTMAYPSDDAGHVREGKFYYGEQELCSVASLKLPGVHNRENACAAISAVWPWVRDGNEIERGLLAFQGLPHRLKLVKDVNEVEYYDDSIATTPGSAIAAIKSFEAPKILILGGSDKGASYGELAQAVMDNVDSMRRVLLIGTEAPKIEAALKEVGFARYNRYDTTLKMDEIVKTAAATAEPGDVVILSPACASFDMFKDYADRGNQFIQAVESL
ncbi:MAG: UDP-N-acetylmuramoyl-L-alanine--D-glutamate ligase [Candidatus Nomurabacteria bacterium]|nr:MAG: UDP-N-acetylmuramoyl-L-alanine--D-glutamate ligase [Candidatus Nomurabacteria bacterium]